MGLRWIAILAAAGALASCAHQRPALRSSIAIPAVQLHASAFDRATGPASTPIPSRLAQLLQDSKSQTGRPAECAAPALAGYAPRPQGSANYTVLSGGSLHGAFGAGFLLGLQETQALPPEADVVTGVSTGSLQATFVFLARQREPADRVYIGLGGVAVEQGPEAKRLHPGRSNIEDLALAYSIRRESDILKPVPFGAVGMLLRGSKGTLDPLRRRLFGLISPATIQEVAAEGCRGRKLFVGVADVDDGHGYALDLTALALLAYDGSASAARVTLVRKAYVEALIASSSVPIGAQPVQLRLRDLDQPPLDQHRINMFVDGGARFGVFMRDLGTAVTQGAATNAAPPDITLIVNTDLSIGPWHDHEDLRDPKSGWLMATLGLRTVDILEDQVYQLSVGLVAARAGMLKMAYLSGHGVGGGEQPEDHLYLGRSCSAWHDADEAAGHPIQFYPGYMACLIDYGRDRGLQGRWNEPTPGL